VTGVRTILRILCQRHGPPEPRLVVTPDRAIVARAGVTVYRILGCAAIRTATSSSPSTAD
jgi:hypothetical protein